MPDTADRLERARPVPAVEVADDVDRRARSAPTRRTTCRSSSVWAPRHVVQVAVGALVEQVEVDARRAGLGDVTGLAHGAWSVVLRQLDASADVGVAEHLRRRRAQPPPPRSSAGTWPGTLCGVVSPSRSSRSATREVGVAIAASRSSDGVEQRRRRSSPTGWPTASATQRGGTRTARRWRRRRRRRRTPACRGCGRRRRCGPGSGPASWVVGTDR